MPSSSSISSSEVCPTLEAPQTTPLRAAPPRRSLHPAARAILFVAITVVLLCLVNHLILRAANVYKDGAALICQTKRDLARAGQIPFVGGKDNVLFMGNSRILAGIIPKEFDALSGGRTASWNAALPALPISPHYFLLKDYLRHYPPPRHIVLLLGVNYGTSGDWADPSGLFDYYATQGMDWPEAASYLLHRRDKTVVWNYLFPARLYDESFRKYVFAAAFRRRELADTWRHNWQIIDQMIADRGYYFIREQAVFPNARLPDGWKPPGETTQPVPDFDLDRDPYVKMFFNLAQEQNIKVLLINAPFRFAQREQSTQMPRYDRQLLNQYPNVAIAPDGWKQKFYPNRLFSDPVHLNGDGARWFTREIWSEFRQVYSQSSTPGTAPAR